MLNSPRLLNLPLLLLANKQDQTASLSVAEIRGSLDAWQRSRSSRQEEDEPRIGATGEGGSAAEGTRDKWDDGGAKDERMASLDVMGISALEG